MCGICGIIDYNHNSAVAKNTLENMCRAMLHRGPDDGGVYTDASNPSVGLGHRRLSIIDLSLAGHQPMLNEDGTIVLVFNGEIYNYRELRPSLEKKGHKFRSNTDSEVLIHLYEEYGIDCVRHLLGMFAFAIWDKNKKHLFLARDRLGKKPLIYSFKNGKFVFASEFRPLLESGAIKKDINKEALHEYLSLGYIPAPLTIYKDVFKLLPAHTMILKDGEISLKQYWELDYGRKLVISEEDAQKELLRVLTEAVKIRLHSDVPLGAFLSGGIDSSTVVALMSKLSHKSVETFSIGFEESLYNELPYARALAQRYNTSHHEFVIRPNALEILPKLVEHYGEPYGDSSSLATYYVAEATRKHVVVALSGDGGDEAFAGYERHRAAIFAESYRKIPLALRRLIRFLTGIVAAENDPKNTIRRLRRFLCGAELNFAERYAYWMSIFSEEEKSKIFCLSNSYPSLRIQNVLNEHPEYGLLDKLLRTDTLTTLADDFLVKVDIASMANSLELRSPFLDHRVFEFAASLPENYKLRGNVYKYILKKAIKDLVPAKNVYRKKMGFAIPLSRWFRAEMKDYLKGNLLSTKCLNRGYFHPDRIKDLVEGHISGKAENGFKLWSLLMLELWHQRFMD